MNIILGDGLLGSSVIGLSGWNYVSRKEHGFDINKPGTWKECIPKGTKTIINLIANTDTYSENIDSLFETNYRAVIRLVDYCNENEIKLVHFSTDYVYEKSKANAKETFKAVPGNAYAMSKLLADEYVMKHCSDYLVLRGAQKVDPFPYEKAFTNIVGNFDYPDVIADLVIKMVKLGATGLYNIGTETKSVYDLAVQTKTDVEPVEAPSHFPNNVTMNLDKMNKLLEEWHEELE